MANYALDGTFPLSDPINGNFFKHEEYKKSTVNAFNIIEADVIKEQSKTMTRISEENNATSHYPEQPIYESNPSRYEKAGEQPK